MTVKSPSNQPPQLLLLAHVDATPSDLHSPEIKEIESFEAAVRPDTEVLVQVRREPTRPGRKLLTGLLSLGAGVGLGLVGLAATSLAGIGVALAGAGMAMYGVKRAVESIRDRIDSPEPCWKGTRTYHIQADRRPGLLDSPILSNKGSNEADVKDFTSFLKTNMKKYPAQVTAVLVGGHGLAWDGLADFSVDEVRTSLRRASVEAGRKPDLLILEACLMGNLETLNQLSSSARYAVVSEETMGAYGLPWQDIMKSLPANGLTAEGLGKAIIKKSFASDQIDTLALINLQKVKSVASSFERMAGELRKVVERDGPDAVRAAIDGAAVFPQPHTFLDPDLRDVGQLARGVVTHVHDAAARQAAADVVQAIKSAVVAGVRKERYQGVSHFTVQGTGMKAGVKPYARSTGFKEWSALLEDIRPWHKRLLEHAT